MSEKRTLLKSNKNTRVREHAKEKGVPLWMLGDAIGKSESRFVVYLRHELPESDQDRLISLVDKIAEERGKEHA